MNPTTGRRRRRFLPLLLFIAFVAVPLIEIYVIIQVGQAIGPWWTILLLLLDGVVGAWLVKREGRRAWQALRTALESRRPPAKELADGALVLIGGTLLLTPGFVLDALGLLLVVPVTRPLFRRLLTAYLGSRVTGTMTGGGRGRTAPGQSSGHGPAAGDAVVRGEVVED
jgi:UPF0716 protein FxsA